MNRRSILRLLGLAPLAAPAAMAVASRPEAAPALDASRVIGGVLPPINYDSFIRAVPHLRIPTPSAPAGEQAPA